MSTKTLVINLTRTTIFVDVRHADGRLDTVQIQDRGRVHIGLGQVVDSAWLEHNHDTIAVHLPVAEVAVRKEPAPTVVYEPPADAAPADESVADPVVVEDNQEQEGSN